MRLRIVTLNVWNTEGAEARHRIINRELRRLAPDIICLQEVVQTPKLRQLDALLAGMKLHSTHQADLQTVAPPFADRYGGTAVASRWPHQVAECVDLRLPDAADVPWATLAVKLNLPGEGELLVIGATSAWRPNAESARERQAIAITDLDARHRTGLPTLVAGRSVLYHYLTWAKRSGKGPGFTWPRFQNPNARAGAEQIIRQPGYRARFDYVFVGSWDSHPKAHASVRSAKLAFNRAVRGIWPSDHFGLMVDIEIGSDR